MSGSLTPEQVRHFVEHGFVRGIDVIDRATAHRELLRLEEIERAHRLKRPEDKRFGPTESHPLRDWVMGLATLPQVLAAARSVLGPQADIRNIDVFDKPAYLGLLWGNSWHRDCDFDDPAGDTLLTAWFSLIDVSRISGCMRFIDGSHRERVVEELPGRWPMRTRPVVLNCLSAGTMSLHHGRLMHRAPGNYSPRRRVAFAVRMHVPPPHHEPVPDFFAWR